MGPPPKLLCLSPFPKHPITILLSVLAYLLSLETFNSRALQHTLPQTQLGGSIGYPLGHEAARKRRPDDSAASRSLCTAPPTLAIESALLPLYAVIYVSREESPPDPSPSIRDASGLLVTLLASRDELGRGLVLGLDLGDAGIVHAVELVPARGKRTILALT
jgi:hypothetical protein